MFFLEKIIKFHIKRDGSRNLQIRWCWNLIWRYISRWYIIRLWRFLTGGQSSGGQSSNFRHLHQNLNFDLMKNCEKLKFQKSPWYNCITPKYICRPNLSIKRLSTKCIFPYIWQYPLHVKAIGSASKKSR